MVLCKVYNLQGVNSMFKAEIPLRYKKKPIKEIKYFL